MRTAAAMGLKYKYVWPQSLGTSPVARTVFYATRLLVLYHTLL